MREERTKKYLNKKRITAVVAALLAVVVLVTGIPAIQAWAVFDESTAVRFSTYKSSHTIEDSVLFIGTHLIHLQALTDELYEKAVQSQSDSEQGEVYYKSELADGTWYNISDASGLSAITTDGTPVPESELDDLYVSYYTGADGLTKDAKSGNVVCIFDDPDPYDLMKMTELEPVRRMYEEKYVATSSDDRSFKYLRDALNSFFAQSVRSETTNEYDRMLKNLQKCYESFCTAKMDEDAQVIMTLMEGIDAARRVEVFQKLMEGGETAAASSARTSWMSLLLGSGNNGSFTDLNKLSEIVNGQYYTAKTKNGKNTEVDPFNMDTALAESVMTGIGQCNDSYTSYSAKMLSPDGSTIRAYIYKQSKELADRCNESKKMATDRTIIALVNSIKYAQNIENGVVGDAEGELKLIDDEFLPSAESGFTSQLSKGVSAEYQDAAAKNQSDAVKKGILDNDKTDVEIARTDLESMITAKKERMSSSDALNYVYERITWAQEQEKNIKNDDFANSAKEVLTAHIEWLRTLAQNVVNSDASLMSELDRLKDLLADYQEKQQDALDEDDLDLAAQYAELIKDTSDKIAAEETRLNEIINSDTATEAEKAAAQIALGQNGLLSDIEKLKQQAMSALNSGITDGLDNTLDMLGTLGAENALLQIKDALGDSSLSASDQEKWGKKIDEAIGASKESSLHDQANASTSGDGSGSGSGTGTGDGSGTGTGDGNGNGSGSGSGSGTGTGDGSGNGSGTGTGDGNGNGSGTGTGDGNGSGDGSGTGTGTGSGDGSGTGTGTGSGDGNGTGTGTGSGSGNGSGTGTGSGTGSGSGSSATNPATMSEQMLTNAIEQVLGAPFSELGADGKIAAAVAMDRLYDNYSNVNAKSLAKQFITNCVSENSPYVYAKLSGHSETEYISLAIIGNRVVTPYRYVYSDFREEATMTYGATSYRFRVGARVVTFADMTTQSIDRYKVEFQTVPYIDEGTAKTYFGCEAEYIADTNYSACVNKKVGEQADQLYNTLTGQS